MSQSDLKKKIHEPMNEFYVHLEVEDFYFLN